MNSRCQWLSATDSDFLATHEQTFLDQESRWNRSSGGRFAETSRFTMRARCPMNRIDELLVRSPPEAMLAAAGRRHKLIIACSDNR